MICGIMKCSATVFLLALIALAHSEPPHSTPQFFQMAEFSNQGAANINEDDVITKIAFVFVQALECLMNTFKQKIDSGEKFNRIFGSNGALKSFLLTAAKCIDKIKYNPIKCSKKSLQNRQLKASLIKNQAWAQRQAGAQLLLCLVRRRQEIPWDVSPIKSVMKYLQLLQECYDLTIDTNPDQFGCNL